MTSRLLILDSVGDLDSLDTVLNQLRAVTVDFSAQVAVSELGSAIGDIELEVIA